jgi:hypothetical protein
MNLRAFSPYLVFPKSVTSKDGCNIDMSPCFYLPKLYHIRANMSPAGHPYQKLQMTRVSRLKPRPVAHL